MATPLPVTHTFVLLVNGGALMDAALLCDFAALNKYMRAKPNVTVISYTSVDPTLTTNMFKTLVFGRDDMGRARDTVLRRGQQVPGAIIVPPGELKNHFLSRLQSLANTLEATQKIAVLICSHGQNTGDAILGSNTVSRYDMLQAISTAKEGVSISITNMGCYSGHWLGMANDITGRDAHIAASSKSREQAFIYRSFSNRFRCGLYTSALIYDLQTNPGSSIKEHHRRVVQEMQLVDPRRDQDTSKPGAEVNCRGLWKAPIGYFIPTSHITRTVADILAEPPPFDAVTRYSFYDRLKTWWRANPNVTFDPATKGYGESSGQPDDPLNQELRHEIAAMTERGVSYSESTWISSAEMVIAGTAPRDLQGMVINTFRYQANLRQRALIAAQHLVLKDVILPGCVHDNYNLHKLSEKQFQWSVDIQRFPNVERSCRLPGDTLGGVYVEHTKWLGCVLEAHYKRIKYFTVTDCQEILERAFAWGEEGNWTSIDCGEDGLALEGAAEK